MGSLELQPQTWRIFGFHCSVSDFGTFLCITACSYRCDAATLALFTTFFGMAMAIAFSCCCQKRVASPQSVGTVWFFTPWMILLLRWSSLFCSPLLVFLWLLCPLGGQLLVGFLTIIVAIAVCYVLDIFIQHHMRWAIGDFGSVRHALIEFGRAFCYFRIYQIDI